MTSACKPACSTAPSAAALVSEPADGADVGLWRVSSSDRATAKAMEDVQKFIDCLSVEEPEGSSLPFGPPLPPFSPSWLGPAATGNPKGSSLQLPIGRPAVPFAASWAAPVSRQRQAVASPQQAVCGDSCLNRQMNIMCDPKLCPEAAATAAVAVKPVCKCLLD